MRILAFTEDSPYITGCTLVFVRLCRAMGMKHDIVLLSNHGATEDLLGPSSKEIRFTLPQYAFSRFASIAVFLFTKGFKEILKKNVVLVNASMTAALALTLAKISRRKVVAYQHDVFYLEENLPQTLSIKKKIIVTIRYQMYHGFLKYFDAVLSPSSATEQRLRRLGCKKIFVIGSPIFGENYA